MRELLQDLRHGLRTLRKHPGFAVAAVLALGIGTGVNTAVFTVVNGVLLRPLAYGDPQALVFVWASNPKTNRLRDPISVPDLVDYRSQSSSLENIASFVYDDFNLSTAGEPARVQGTMVSANFFATLGVVPRLGRAFSDEEERSSAERVVVISDGLWKRRFGADPGIIDRTVQLNGATFTVVGVTGPDFRSPEKGDELWIPMCFDGGDRIRVPSSSSPEQLNSRSIRFLKCVGRVVKTSTVQAAQTELLTIASRLEQQYPASNAGFSVNLVPIRDQLVGDMQGPLKMLLAIVGLVLLIACANVANLLLAKGASRQRELAIRTALGAKRSRLFRQLLTESFLLGILGGVAGLLLAYAGITALIRINPSNIPRLDEISIDLRVLGFTLAVSILTGLIFGVVPAIHASKPDLQTSLKEGGRGATESPARRQIRHILVILEVALTQMLLISAALMIKSFYSLQAVDPGFNPEGVLTLQVALPPSKYIEDQQIRSFFEQLLHRIETIPGVQAAAVSTTLPLQADTAISRRFTIVGRPPASPNEHLSASYRAISPEFFNVLNVAMLRGRAFADSDSEKSPPVIIVNEAMAHQYWGEEDPIGRRIAITAEGGVTREIVGVVRNIKQSALDADAGAEMYEPYLQFPWSFMAIVVRGSTDPLSLAPGVQREILAIDPAQAAYDVKSMRQIVSESINQPRLYTVLLAVFAGVALMLAAIGIYGVLSFSIAQRTQEIGVRMALGATPSDILRMVVGGAMMLAAIGLVIGEVAAFWLSRVLSDLLYAVSPRDVLVFIGVPVLLGLVALISSYFPAKRSTRVDPIIALRSE